MNRKRGREYTASPTMYLKRQKYELDITKEKNMNISTFNMAMIIVKRVDNLEKKVKDYEGQIADLHNSNMLYIQKLYEIYSYLGITTSAIYNHSDSYIS